MPYTRYVARSWCLVFQLLLLVSSNALAGDNAVNRNDFVSHTIVETAWGREPELCQAMDESRRSFGEFVKAFERREVRQMGFMVTVMRRAGAKLIPVGVLVESIQKVGMKGLEVPNALACKLGAEIRCGFDEVIDWRYTDTFELVGGRLYRVLFHRQASPIQRKIGNYQDFLLEWDKQVPMDAEFLDLIRDVANLRYAEVERKLKADETLHNREALVPVPGLQNDSDRRVKLRLRRVSEYAAEFADAPMMKILHSLGALHEAKRHDAPLIFSSIQGNVDTTRCMLDLKFDVEVSDDREGCPLEYAVRWDHENVVALLLERGANCNRRDNGMQTPLFHAKSVAVTQRLLAAGARVDAVDDQGTTCVQKHLEHGRADIADLLVKHGAKRDSRWELGLNDAQTMQKGREVLKQHFQATDPQGLADFELGVSMDYGYILPIREIAIP